MRIREPPPLAGELVDVRRLHLRGPVAPEIAVTKIIGEDENDVWRLRREERRTKSKEDENKPRHAV
jgi:hypothetical protein